MAICSYFVPDFRNLTQSKRAIDSRTIKCSYADENLAIVRQCANEFNGG